MAPASIFALLALFALTSTFAESTVFSTRPYPKAGAMPWMCLERCGFNSSEISHQLAQLEAQANASGVTSISYEWGDLGPNGTFIFNGFTSVSERAAKFAVSVPMLTTVRLAYIRQLFDTEVAENFVTAVVQAALRESNIDGFNFDFEPTDDSPSQADAIGYANFLRIARRVFWEQGKMFLTVDVAEWSTVWNWTLINSALTEPLSLPATRVSVPVGLLVTMSTYATSDSIFVERLQKAIQIVSPNALVVGLDVWHSDPDEMNRTQVAYRIGALAAVGVCRVGVWQVPLPIFWVEQLTAFFQTCIPRSGI
jgi:hypothetical protein